MRKSCGVFFFVAVFALLVTAAYARRAKQEKTTEAPPQVIEMTANHYAFVPSPLHIKVGTTVQLKVTAIDKTHGILISTIPAGAAKDAPPGLEFAGESHCYELRKGETVTIEFTAREAGIYPFKCCKLCGIGHWRMKGEIIVEP